MQQHARIYNAWRAYAQRVGDPMMQRLAALIFAAVLLSPAALSQSIPFPGPGGVAGLGTPASIGTRTISGITSTCNITTTAALLAGDLAFVVVQVASSPLRTVASVSDGTNSYTLGKAINDGVNFDNELWYIGNAAGVGSGATLTITLSGATNNNGCAAQAYRARGYSATPIDVTASQSATTATPSVTTAVLAQASELAVGSSWVTGGGATPYTEASGFTNLANALAVGNGNGNASNAFKLTTATTAVTYAPTWNASQLCETLIVTFKGP